MSNEDWNELDESYRSALSGALETAHPAVEQAGGDERAACNLWIAEQQLCQGSDISLFKLERNGALVSLHELLRDAYQAGQARAALAQPSPALAEQEEAERPEVVAYFDRNYPSTGDAFIWSNYEGSPYEPVMTVAQHERIVGSLRAERDGAIKLLGQSVWQKIERLTQERDAALARVAELEGKLTDWVHEGFRLNEALAVAQVQHSVPDDDMILQIFADNAEHSEQGGEHGYCIVREQHALAIARKLLATAPVCRLSRSALTDAQMRRLYDSSTETENERLGFAAFARLIRRAEAVHQIAAAPGKGMPNE
ncbi:hypothetical protein N0052_27435 [Pseudomonas aeruginosa]|nr:hypothetical protein [Pseudomonas aeruginosa]